MPVFVFAFINLVFAALVVGGIVGLLSWSVATQHRDPGCGEIRLARRRLFSRRRRLARQLERPVKELVLR
jgi:hypothetical protein